MSRSSSANYSTAQLYIYTFVLLIDLLRSAPLYIAK